MYSQETREHKIHQAMVASGVEDRVKEISQIMLQALTAASAADLPEAVAGNIGTIFAEEFEKAKIISRTLDAAVKDAAERLNDQEAEELLKIYSNPVFKKMLNSEVERMQKVQAIMMPAMDEVTNAVKARLDELEKDSTS